MSYQHIRDLEKEIDEKDARIAELEAQLSQSGEPVAQAFFSPDGIGFSDVDARTSKFLMSHTGSRVGVHVGCIDLYTRPVPDAEVMRDAARYRLLRTYSVDSYIASGLQKDLDRQLDEVIAKGGA